MTDYNAFLAQGGELAAALLAFVVVAFIVSRIW